MEYRNFDVTLVSGHGLKDINLVGKMDLYAVAYLSGLPNSKQKTKVHTNCGTNPRWNHKMKFTLDERSLVSPPGGGLYLVVQIMAEKFGSDKDVGEVRFDLLELFQGGVEVEKMVDYKIGGRGKGTLSISYKFGEKYMQDSSNAKSNNMNQPPPVAYPPYGGGYEQAGPNMPPQQGAYPMPQQGAYPMPQQGYGPGMPPQQQGAYPMDKGHGMGGPPPQQQGAYPMDKGYGMGGPPPAGYPPTGYPAYGAPYGNPGYGAPPPQGYGGYYPSPQGGYAPPPQQPYGHAGYNQHAAHKKKKKSGGMMGMGMGLGAGLLGGMLVGEMVGEVGEAAAYADGYSDAMGGDAFDF